MPVETDIVTDEVDHQSRFLEDVWRGLSAQQKTVAPKYLYDAHGSQLFEHICELDEYYPTRIELGIMEDSVAEMAEAVGAGKTLLELGSGASLKTRLLLSAMHAPAAYVPYDISYSALEGAARVLEDEFPRLDVFPVCGDFLEGIQLPSSVESVGGIVVYFPGSTIGNLSTSDIVLLLRQVRQVSRDGGMLLGVDLRKESQVLERAYNDSQGITAAFNLNLLSRINRELDGTFDVSKFEHSAIYNEPQGRIEMHLVSLIDQTVEVSGEEFFFAEGETICTEHSHKFTISEIRELAEQAGFQIEQVWTDPAEWFAVMYLTPYPGSLSHK